MSEEKQEIRKSPSERRTVLYTIIRVIAFIVFHTICPVVYHGKEKLRQKGPYILISNHFSNWDPLVNGSPIRQEIIFLGKKELMKSPLIRWIFRSVRMIPVDRHNTDMTAMRNCFKALKEEEILVIYPEGTRHHEGIMEKTESGIATIALRQNVPVVPMLIDSKVRPFHVTHVYVGDDIPTADLRETGINKQTCQLFMERMQETYRTMIREKETHGQVDYKH